MDNTKYNQEITDKEKNIIENIYKYIFKDFNKNHVDVFLCGGDLKQENFRSFIKEHFESCASIKVFYPEIIFEEYYNIKNTDYLTLENILAEQVDFVCIVCESWGSVTELGAFTNSNGIKDKIIALNHIDYKSKPSFITRGPIKYLEKNIKDSVFYYDDSNKDTICEQLQSKFKKFIKNNTQNRDINKITGMFYFIAILLYLFKYLDKAVLLRYTKYIVDYLKIKDMKFDPIFVATKKLLFYENFIKSDNDIFSLTSYGEKFINEYINKKDKDIYNKVIADIIMYRY